MTHNLRCDNLVWLKLRTDIVSRLNQTVQECRRVHRIMVSIIISAVDEVIKGISNLELTPEETIQEFFSGRSWCYNGNATLSASFGKFRDLTRVGRVKQLNDVWKQILKSNLLELRKSEILYFHGSKFGNKFARAIDWN